MAFVEPSGELEEETAHRDFEEACRLLPTWFVPRMMGDIWHFALLTADGILIGISTIFAVRPAPNGDIWLDVWLLEDDDPWLRDLRKQRLGLRTIGAPTDRVMASVNARHVIAAFEIANT